MVAKEPVPGRVKTRLCPPCTPAQAAAVAEAALADTLGHAVASSADEVVLALDGRPGPWCPPGVRVVDQGTGGFDLRLARAWSSVSGPTVQIGMDTPQATAEALDHAMATLTDDGTDAVFGHAADGGWWSVGMRSPDPAVFLGVTPSRTDTGRRQLERLRDRGMTVSMLDRLRDVDTWSDALTVAASCPPGRFSSMVGALGDILPSAREIAGGAESCRR